MHFIARQRRSMLRRRIANGEIDLEALGIKRLMVPKEVLDKMPLYPYTSTPTPPVTHDRSSSDSTINQKSPTIISVLSHPRSHRSGTGTGSGRNSHYLEQQTTCAICLDDFTSAPPSPSLVRELPCGHIFHAECVDPFLTTHSSLCPLCKKSSLPVGYVPKTITNTMVRRERQVRRLRGRSINVNGNSEDVVRGTVYGLGPGHPRAGQERSLVDRIADGRFGGIVTPRVRNAINSGRRVFSAPNVRTGNAAREMQEIRPDATTSPAAPVTVATTGAVPAVIPADGPSSPTRSQQQEGREGEEIEEAEQGAREEPALQPMANEAESSRSAATPKTGWRGVAGRLFPRSG